MVLDDNDKSMRSVATNALNSSARKKTFSSLHSLIFLRNLLNKLATLEVREFLCPEISTMGPVSLHARDKRFFDLKFNFKYLDNIS